MNIIISGTNRKGSRSRQLADVILKLYQKNNLEGEILSLEDLPFHELGPETYFSSEKPQGIQWAIDKLNRSESIYFIVPEYNGSFPGALKYFIDHWTYPDTFEYRPVAFMGLGSRFGGLRPVEHLQGVLGYRNAYMFPQRIFFQNVMSVFKDGEIKDSMMNELIEDQVHNFAKFIHAIHKAGLDANSVLANKT